jgi:hypothetical protein
MNDDILGIQVPEFINGQSTRIVEALKECQPYNDFDDPINRSLFETVRDAIGKMSASLDAADRIHDRSFKGISLRAAS